MKKLFCILLLTLGITSCDVVSQQTVNTGIDTLNEAIRRLESNSESWQMILEESRDKLIQEGQSTLANEVSNVLSRATSDLGVEAKCYTDFLRDRTRDELIKVRATVTGEDLQLNPVFCAPTPSAIDMNLSPDRRPLIEIAGYNLTRDSIRVFLEHSQNPDSDVSNSLDNPTSYLLTITLDKIPLDDNSERLRLELENGQKHTIGIIQAYRPPKEEFRISQIHITGSINMNDDEYIVSDQNKNIPVNTYVEVSNNSTNYHWEDCVGDEVQGYLDVQMQLNKETGVVSGQGSARYYEGTRCGQTDLQGNHSFDFRISPGESYLFQRNLSDNDGGVSYNLNFFNESVQKVIVDQ